LAELRSARRLDETIIVFWSDNGPPFSRAKGTLYEQGVRVPLLISGPGIKAGQVRDELVSTIDLMPTLLAMTAIELPASRQAYPGRDLGPLLRGEQVSWREYVFTELTFHTPYKWRPARAVTDGRWKLVHNLAAEKPAWRIRLYDLVADPEERVNLANRSSKKKQRERLENLLLQWRASTGDPLLDSGTYDRLAQIPLDPGQSILPWYQPP
jgi:N-sulfoglucosamine sulfohydrolase